MEFETNDFEMEMLILQEYEQQLQVREQQLQETELRLQEYKQRLLEAQAQDQHMSEEQVREFLENYGDIGIIGGADAPTAEFLSQNPAKDSEETTETTVKESSSSAKDMSIADAGITAVFGYAVVFVGLVILMAVLYITGAIFKAKDAKAAAAAKAEPEKKAAPAPAAEKPVAPGSAGHVKLFDVPDKEAAMIMAIVADKMQKPLNELHFISIKEVK